MTIMTTLLAGCWLAWSRFTWTQETDTTSLEQHFLTPLPEALSPTEFTELHIVNVTLASIAGLINAIIPPLLYPAFQNTNPSELFNLCPLAQNLTEVLALEEKNEQTPAPNPLVLFFVSEADHNGALTTPEKMPHRYPELFNRNEVLYIKIKSFSEMCQIIAEAVRIGFVQTVIINAHGEPDKIQLAINRWDGDGKVNRDGQITRRSNIVPCFNPLPSSTHFLSLSCSTAPLASFIASQINRLVIAPSIVFDAQGTRILRTFPALVVSLQDLNGTDVCRQFPTPDPDSLGGCAKLTLFDRLDLHCTRNAVKDVDSVLEDALLAAAKSGRIEDFDPIVNFIFYKVGPHTLGQAWTIVANENYSRCVEAITKSDRFNKNYSHYFGEALTFASERNLQQLIETIIESGQLKKMDPRYLGEALVHSAKYQNRHYIETLITTDRLKEINSHYLGEALAHSGSHFQYYLEAIIKVDRFKDLDAHNLGEILEVAAHYNNLACMESIIQSDRFKDINSHHLGEALKLAADWDNPKCVECIIQSNRFKEIDSDHLEQVLRSLKDRGDNEGCEKLKVAKEHILTDVPQADSHQNTN